MIDPTKPVHLKTMIRDIKTGNVYIPLNRAYQPGEIPFRLLTDANAYQDESTAEVVVPTQSTVTQIAPPLELSSSQIPSTKLEPAQPRTTRIAKVQPEASELKTE
jgi:hypothetical protein